MNDVVELGYAECLDLLGSQDFGRVDFHPLVGVRIVPVSYAVIDGSVVWRTTPYSELGTYGSGHEGVFEVDSVDTVAGTAWSVVASGRIHVIDGFDEVVLLREFSDPKPLAGGSRSLYMRLSIDDLTGRRIGPGSGSAWLMRMVATATTPVDRSSAR